VRKIKFRVWDKENKKFKSKNQISLSLDGKIIERKNKASWYFCSKKDCLHIFNYMYGNTTFFLTRKYNKFLEIVKWEP